MRSTGQIRLAALTLVLLTWAAPGWAQDTGKRTGERIGEKLDQVGRDVRGGLDRAGQGVKERFAAAKSTVQGMGIEARVYSRLHWDKALNDATIDLAVSGEGVVTLKGSVATPAAKVKAAELTRDTLGVTGIVDQLAVAPPTERSAAAPSR